MSDVMEGAVSFSNNSVQASQGFSGDREWRRFKVEQGKSYRIRFTSSQVEMRHRHYNPQDKRYYRCLGHTGYCPVCLAASQGFGGDGQFKLRKAQETFGANILVYDTDALGNPTQPLNAEVYFWSFGPDKFVQVRELQASWGDITNLDLKVTCTDQQFQKMSIINLPQCLYNSDANFKAACDAKIEKESYPLDKMICREIDLMAMINAFKLPQQYIPEGMLSQMPQGEQTVMDYATGSQPVQSVVPQLAPVVAPTAPVPQAAPIPQPVPQAAPQVAPQQPQAAPVQPQTTVQPQPAPVQPVPQPSQVTPVQPEVPADVHADIDDLQNMLNL